MVTMPTAPPVISIASHDTSAQLRARLVERNSPVLLAFSRGKDSIAAWLALRAAGIETIPYHLDLIPGLRFVNRSIDYFENYFDTRIIRLPHPSFYRWLNNRVFVPPERSAIIAAANMVTPTFDNIYQILREDYADTDTPICQGVRAADSPMRRIDIAKHGGINHTTNVWQPVWDWRITHIRTELDRHNIVWPEEYKWFNRSFDGIDYRFLEPLKTFAPDDYQTILDWFPLANLELFRKGLHA